MLIPPLMLAIAIGFTSWQSDSQDGISLRNVLGGEHCQQPCWQNIVPNVTQFEELAPILENAIGDINIQNRLEGGPYIYEWEYEDVFPTIDNPETRDLVFVVFSEQGVVSQVNAAVDVCISTVLAELGEPTAIGMEAGISQNFYYLFYREQGLYFNLSAALQRATNVTVTSPEAVTEMREVSDAEFSWEKVAPMFSGECSDNFTQDDSA